METVLSLVALVALVATASSVGGRWLTRKKGAFWVWDHSTGLGWGLIAVGCGLIGFGFAVDQAGMAMSTKLGLGSVLLFIGLWMIW